MREFNSYIAVYPDGVSFVMVDIASGGYPTAVKKLRHATFWDTVEEVETYIKRFPEEKLTVATVSMKISLHR